MPDERAVLALIDHIYVAAIEPDAWAGVFAELAELQGACSAGVQFRLHTPSPFVELAWAGLDPECERDYASYFYLQDPWVPPCQTLPSGACLIGQEVVAQQDLMRSEFYNDWMQRFDFGYWQGCLPYRDENELVGIGMHRPVGGKPFDSSDRVFLERLAPHFRRAVEIYRRMVQARQAGETFAAILDRLPFGVILADPDGRVVRTNRSADRMLAARDGLALTRSGLQAVPLRLTRTLARLVADAARPPGGPHAPAASRRGGACRIPRRSGRRPYTAVVMPIGERPALEETAVAALFVIDPDQEVELASDQLRRLFGLTQAEARLALLLGDGLALKEAAGMLEVSWHTARSQLKAVFAKLAVDRQASLVQLLARLTQVSRTTRAIVTAGAG